MPSSLSLFGIYRSSSLRVVLALSAGTLALGESVGKRLLSNENWSSGGVDVTAGDGGEM